MQSVYIDEHGSNDVKHCLEKQLLLNPEFHSKARQFQVSTCFHYRRATESNAATMHMVWFDNDSEMFRKVYISATKKQINTFRHVNIYVSQKVVKWWRTQKPFQAEKLWLHFIQVNTLRSKTTFWLHVFHSTVWSSCAVTFRRSQTTCTASKLDERWPPLYFNVNLYSIAVIMCAPWCVCQSILPS